MDVRFGGLLPHVPGNRTHCQPTIRPVTPVRFECFASTGEKCTMGKLPSTVFQPEVSSTVVGTCVQRNSQLVTLIKYFRGPAPKALTRCDPLGAGGDSAYSPQWRKAALTFHAKTSHQALGSEADKKKVAVLAQRKVDGGSSRSRDCGSRVEQSEGAVRRNKIAGDGSATRVRNVGITIVLCGGDPAIRFLRVRHRSGDQLQRSVVTDLIRGEGTRPGFSDESDISTEKRETKGDGSARNGDLAIHGKAFIG